ncbi:MAG: GNAT family N-acetyltransferase [Victivallaceae bacterium]
MVNSENIIFKTIKQAADADIVRLYQDADWWQAEYDTNFIQPMIQHSFVFIAAFDGEKMIGMGRVISDGFSDGYIQDVTVLKAYRGQGIGSAIIKQLIAAMQTAGIDWIGLVGEPGTQQFYERLGFKPLTNFIPMQFQP